MSIFKDKFHSLNVLQCYFAKIFDRVLVLNQGRPLCHASLTVLIGTMSTPPSLKLVQSPCVSLLGLELTSTETTPS